MFSLAMLLASSQEKAASDLIWLMTLYMPCLQLYIHYWAPAHWLQPADISVQDVGTDEDEGQVKWRQQLCLSHVRLRSTSVAVLEVHYRPPAVEAAEEAAEEAGASEVIAWAYTKIVQVSSIATGLSPGYLQMAGAVLHAVHGIGNQEQGASQRLLL